MDLKEVAKDIIKGLNTFENVVSSAVDKISHGYENNQIEIVFKRLEKGLKELLKEDKMKKIIMNKDERETINFEDVDKNEPIFCKKEGKFIGMIVEEDDEGWIVRIGGCRGVAGYHKTLKRCIEKAYAENLGYEFYVN